MDLGDVLILTTIKVENLDGGWILEVFVKRVRKDNGLMKDLDRE